MKSMFLDFLKLTFSEKYEMSDREYKALSDILLSKGLAESVYENGLIQTLALMIHHDCTMPISIDYLKEIWEQEYSSFNFVHMLGELVKTKLVSLRRYSKNTYMSATNITKSTDESYDKDVYVVIHGSESFTDLLTQFKTIIQKADSSVNESAFGSMPKKYSDTVSKASKLLNKMNISVSVESYSIDAVLNTLQLNLILGQTSRYTLNDRDILKYAKKSLTRSKGVVDVEAYKESDSELYLGLTLDTKSDLRGIADCIYFFVEAIEVNGVE